MTQQALITSLKGQDGAHAYGMHACNGMLFHYASLLRGEAVVTRQITRAVACVTLELQDGRYLGNLYVLRDWGHSCDYVEMGWLTMLQEDNPEVFFIAASVQCSVRQFVECACNELRIEVGSQARGVSQLGIMSTVNNKEAKVTVGDTTFRVDRWHFRLTEAETLLGDRSKAKDRLRWPPKTWLQELLEEILQSDHFAAKRNALGKDSRVRVCCDNHEQSRMKPAPVTRPPPSSRPVRGPGPLPHAGERRDPETPQRVAR